MTSAASPAAEADANEIAALSDWIAAMAPDVRARFGVRLDRFDGGAALIAPETGTAFFNRVIGLGNAVPASRDLVHDLVAMYRALDTTFMVHVGNPEYGEWLTEQGLALGGEWLVLHRDADQAPSDESGIHIERVGSEQAEVFARTLCRGYGMPPEWAPLYEGFVGAPQWRHYLAFIDDAPIATSSLFHNGDLVWGGNTCTLPAYRGRGVQTALNRIRLRDGIAAGCRRFTGETWRPIGNRPNHSLNNHTRDGWRLVYVRANHVYNPFT